MKRLRVSLLSVMVLMLMSVVVNAGVIDTTPDWDGSSYIAFFGEPNTATYGQTFTVGSDSVLDSFSFYLNDLWWSPDSVDFAAYVMPWDGAKANGAILYSSSPLSTTNNGGLDGFENITIDVGGLSLIGNSQYVAFFSASNDFDGLEGRAGWAGTADIYAGGNFVYMNNGSDFGLLTTTTWKQKTSNDLAFRMSFSSDEPVHTPEPSTWILLTSGFAGLVWYGRKRKKA